MRVGPDEILVATLKLETTPEATVSPAKAPVSPAKADQPVNAVLGTVQNVRTEIDDALADMKVFKNFEPDQVMAAISSHSARLVEIAVQISRIEHIRREWRPVREECERVVGELKNQLTIASRMHAIREFDWTASGKGQM